MNKKVLITGATSKIGREIAEAILKTGAFDLKLFLDKSAESKLVEAYFQGLHGQSVEIFTGNITKYADCEQAVEGVDYVVHLAAVRPPVSCHNPDATEKINYFGTKNLVDAVKNIGRGAETKFIYGGSVTEYGNRDFHHPWARVGDPLIPSLFDVYSITKIRAERYVVESGLKYWTCLRTAPMLYDGIVKDLIDDGIILQMPLNAPVELMTISEACVLYKNLLAFDANGTLAPEFWRKIYNAGGGAPSRLTGYELYQKCLALLNGKPEKLLEPHWLPTRNYFTSWFSDGELLDGYLKYQSDGIDKFFEQQGLLHAYLKAAKHLSPVLKKLLYDKVVDSPNSPYYWVDNGMTDRVNAFFGGYDEWGKLPRRWDKVSLLVNNVAADVDGKIYDVDYKEIKKHENAEKMKLEHGFDEKKGDSFLGYDDFQQAAQYRGGKCLSAEVKRGDLHSVLKWQCADGHVFRATAYGVLKAGYWCTDCCSPAPWDFDNSAKKSPFFAQLWYDTHREDETLRLTAECYNDIPREDERDPILMPKDKIKKYRKG